MFNLSDKNISYLIFPSDLSTIEYERSCNILYSKDYSIIPISTYEGKYERSYIAISSTDNDNLRFDAIFLTEQFNKSSVIIKYLGESNPTKILNDGSEIPMDVILYNEDINSKVYLYNGVSFSFLEKKIYFFPKKKDDFKNGMVIEYFNNNKWNTKSIHNIEQEFDKMYKLLIKYEKVRVEI